jgi:hypothetical protein
MTALVILFSISAAFAQAPGFGRVNRKTIALQRKLPAVVQLPGDHFAVNVTASDPRGGAVTARLKIVIETEMAKYDPQLMVDPKKPDTDIAINILNLDVPQPAPIMGSNKPTNPFKLGGNKKPQQQQVIGYDYKGHLEVAYQARTPGGGFVDADEIKTSFSEQTNTQTTKMEQSVGSLKNSVANLGGFGGLTHRGGQQQQQNSASTDDNSAGGPKTVQDVQNILMSKLTALIAARLVNTNETLEIELARGGALDDALKYADVRQWTKMAEALETMAPYKEPRDESYRYYDLGVAYEALGYSAETAEGAKRNLEEAAADYGKAADLNPAERGFLEPQNRIEIALEHYKKLNAPEAGKPGNKGTAQ